MIIEMPEIPFEKKNNLKTQRGINVRQDVASPLIHFFFLENCVHELNGHFWRGYLKLSKYLLSNTASVKTWIYLSVEQLDEFGVGEARVKYA